jgi:hypothetical protein
MEEMAIDPKALFLHCPHMNKENYATSAWGLGPIAISSVGL